MNQLPRVANAILDDRKITQYLLSTTHPTGASKAKFFISFGFSPGNWAELKSALLHHPQNNPVTNQVISPFGQKFEVSCSLVAPDGRNPCIISVWIIEPPDPNPRFITAYPNP
jgi:Domain of unknown function (DUF6883)